MKAARKADFARKARAAGQHLKTSILAARPLTSWEARAPKRPSVLEGLAEQNPTIRVTRAMQEASDRRLKKALKPYRTRRP